MISRSSYFWNDGINLRIRQFNMNSYSKTPYFTTLPAEIQVQIITNLPATDSLNLRQVSRSLRALIDLYELSIARYQLRDQIPNYARQICTLMDGTDPRLQFVAGLLLRLERAKKLSITISQWVMEDVFLHAFKHMKCHQELFEHQKENVQQRLVPALFAVSHFFDTFGKLSAPTAGNSCHIWLDDTSTFNLNAVQVLNAYNDRMLVRLYQIFPLVVTAFCRRIRRVLSKRPPSTETFPSIRGPDKKLNEKNSSLSTSALRQGQRGKTSYYRHRQTRKPTFGPMSKSQRRQPLLSLNNPCQIVRHGARRVLRQSQYNTADHRVYVENAAMKSSYNELNEIMIMLGCKHAEDLEAELEAFLNRLLILMEKVILGRKIVKRIDDLEHSSQVLLSLVNDYGSDLNELW